MYADFIFYAEKYMGTLSDEEFARLSVRAKAEIDRLTFGRASAATGKDLEAVQFAFCAVVDELSNQAKGISGEIVSESNDGISRSYASGVAKTPQQRIQAAADLYLYNTNLLACPI